MGDVILNRAPVALVKKATQAITVFFDHFSWHQILLLLAFASVAVVLMIIVAAACAGMRSGGQLWIPLPIGVAIVIGTPSPERMTAGRSELSIAATRLRDYLETSTWHCVTQQHVHSLLAYTAACNVLALLHSTM